MFIDDAGPTVGKGIDENWSLPIQLQFTALNYLIIHFGTCENITFAFLVPRVLVFSLSPSMFRSSLIVNP